MILLSKKEKGNRLICHFPFYALWTGGGYDSMKAKYISDVIGDEYLEWSSESTIFISSPTGSGKTHFILKNFLDLMSKDEKLLYLVNRKALKTQIEEDLKCLEEEKRSRVIVELYQTIESMITELEYDVYNDTYKSSWFQNPKLKKYVKCTYVVCDECHYFLADSNFNTNTILSYRFVRDFFMNKIKIYISATINDIKEYIMRDKIYLNNQSTSWFGFGSSKSLAPINNPTYMYSMDRNYDYIKIGIVSSREGIVDLVKEGKEKWLIFVDSINFGKKLKRDIDKINNDNKDNKNYQFITSAFVTSDYRLDPETAEEMGNITKESKQLAQVLIATSVLDNGINLHDIELRNLVICADNETEFIQMLGRKRGDGLPIKVYLYRYNQEHFKKRLRNGQKKYDIAYDNYQKIKEEIEPEILKLDTVPGYNINWVNAKEGRSIIKTHILLMKNIMDNKYRFEDIQASFLIMVGYLYLNLLSKKNLENLNFYYRKVIKLFEEGDEDAFFKEQLRWMNKCEEELIGAKETEFETSKRIIIKALEDAIIKNKGNVFDAETLTKVKDDHKEQFRVIIKKGKDKPDYNTYCNIIEKKKKVMSRFFMDFIRTYCEIPFVLTVNNSQYTLVKDDSFHNEQDENCKKIQTTQHHDNL